MDVLSVLNLAAANGYTAFKVKNHDTFGFLITPDKNILTVNRGTWGGVHITFDYIPSRKTGSGCSCEDDDIYEIDIEYLKKLEIEGFKFAKRLKATFYSSPEAWFNESYWKNDLIKI